MGGPGGCLRLLYFAYFGWVHVVASRNARAFGHENAVPGPEATDLVARLNGTLVWQESRGGIRAVTLPELAQKHLRLPQPWSSDQQFAPAVHTVAGPDHQGRVAYVEQMASLRR